MMIKTTQLLNSLYIEPKRHVVPWDEEKSIPVYLDEETIIRRAPRVIQTTD